MNEVTLVREMGCNLADFARWLPGATNHAPVVTTQSSNEVLHRLSVGNGTVEIHLLPQPDRKIAPITLPVLRVTFRFIGLDEMTRNAFLKTFDHYTQRGGG